MSNQKDDNILSCIYKETVRVFIERIQGIRRVRDMAELEPEIDSSRVICEVEDILNIPYMNRDEIPLAMDIFKPVLDEDFELPVVVIIHGGGLVLGNRGGSRPYGRALASRGYLVFSVEYRLAPRANTCEQLDDVCAGLDMIGQKLVDFNVDFTRLFLSAESAGAFLAIYVAAMKRSKKLQEAIGYNPSRMIFKALGLHSGMFYTDRDDPIGWVLKDQFFGEKTADKNFLQYLDPEHEEIVKNLPPVFLTTSKGDFLNNYTIMYNKALKKAGNTSHMLYYGNDDLCHAFAWHDLHRKEVITAIDKMCDFFDEKAAEATIVMERHKKEQETLNEIDERLANGEMIQCKSWKFIKEMNSYSLERLNSVALIDGKREYTYRQMFRMWDRYAEVFSALEITQQHGCRVGMMGTCSVESIASIYALNMTGTSVSLITNHDFDFMANLEKVIEKERITDLIVNDLNMKSRILEDLLEKKDSLGIRNVIILRIPVGGKFKTEEEAYEHRVNIRRLKRVTDKTPGALYMDDLLVKYEAWPIIYGSEESADDAIVLHTSGTTNGIHKPVPLSDEGFNEAVARLVRDERFQNLRGRAVTVNLLEMAMSYGLVDGVHLPLAFGGKILTVPGFKPGLTLLKILNNYKINVMFSGTRMFNALMKLPISIDFSNLEFIFAGGAYMSAETKKKSDKYLKKNGSKAKISIGYGLTEIGAACILADSEREDDAIGYPLSGVKVKIYDEEEKAFYNLEDGPRIGIMYLSSKSVSSGRLDDTVFFELDEIDGEKYYNTYDLVRVNEDGSLAFLGRANKYFINNDGIRFDAGLVETAMSAESGIEGCGLVPAYSKVIHDTVPVLYVTTTKKGHRAVRTVRQALINVFIKQDHFKETNLPAQVVIAEDLPHNNSGKVDVHKIQIEKTKGDKYKISPVKRGEKLVDIRLVDTDMMDVRLSLGVPDELQEDIKRMQSKTFNKERR